jgi:hypothetical protein
MGSLVRRPRSKIKPMKRGEMALLEVAREQMESQWPSQEGREATRRCLAAM